MNNTVVFVAQDFWCSNHQPLIQLGLRTGYKENTDWSKKAYLIAKFNKKCIHNIFNESDEFISIYQKSALTDFLLNHKIWFNCDVKRSDASWKDNESEEQEHRLHFFLQWIRQGSLWYSLKMIWKLNKT